MKKQVKAQMIAVDIEDFGNNDHQTFFKGKPCKGKSADVNNTAPTPDCNMNGTLSNSLVSSTIPVDNDAQTNKFKTTLPENSLENTKITNPNITSSPKETVECRIKEKDDSINNFDIKYVPPSSNTNNKNIHGDATDTSYSDYVSSDSDFEEEDRVLVRKWEEDRSKIAWRWNWLQLQVEELKYQLKECDKILEELRKKKPKIIPFMKEELTQTTRTCPVQLSKQYQTKLVFLTPPKDTTLLDDDSSYPALHIKERKKKKDGNKFCSPKPDKRRNPSFRENMLTISSPRVHHTRSSASPRFSSPSSPCSENSNFSPRTRRQKRKDSECGFDNTIFPTPVGIFSPRIHKEILTPSWQEIDKMDINAAFEAAIEKENKKKQALVDIFTKEEEGKSDEQPREGSVPIKLDNTQQSSPFLGEGSPDCISSTQIELEVSLNSSCENIESLHSSQKGGINEPNDDIKDRSSSHDVHLKEGNNIVDSVSSLDKSSSEEDTNDEAFCQRHLCRELLERKRYLFPDKNKNLPASPDQLPVEFFVSVLADSPGKRRKRNNGAELEKMRQKYEKIKWRYLNVQQEQKSWEDLAYLANYKEIKLPRDFVEIDTEHEFFYNWDDSSEEEEEVSCIEIPPPEIWNVVSKPPVMDDQGRHRNIIYLRRVVDTSQPSAVE